MRVFEDIHQWRVFRKTLQGSCGFVPTMGALHEGHRALLERARGENEKVVLSIYVNPTQFNNPEDLEKYPQTLKADLGLAQSAGVDYVILPKYLDIYPDGYRFRVTENSFSQKLCGAHRPGHFDGVLTVVLKLLNMVQPDRAYFGEKDYQQMRLVSEMVSSFFIPTEIVACPTVRSASRLALSSRNQRLSPEQLQTAEKFPQILLSSETAGEARKRLEHAGFLVDYVEDMFGRRLAAVTLGNVRLIDNVVLETPCELSL